MTLQDLYKFQYVQVRKPANDSTFWVTLEFSPTQGLTVMSNGYGINPELALNMAYNSFVTQLEESFYSEAKAEFYNV